MIGALFFHEQTMYQNQYSWLDKHLGQYGFDTILVVDHLGGLKAPFAYPTLDEALATVPEHVTRVWLDHKAELVLDEFVHPQNDVLYLIGSDHVGFEGKGLIEMPGVHVKVRQPLEMYAAMILPMVCYDRFLYLNGRRA